jgi:hypothetical protein
MKRPSSATPKTKLKRGSRLMTPTLKIPNFVLLYPLVYGVTDNVLSRTPPPYYLTQGEVHLKTTKYRFGKYFSAKEFHTPSNF